MSSFLNISSASENKEILEASELGNLSTMNINVCQLWRLTIYSRSQAENTIYWK